MDEVRLMILIFDSCRARGAHEIVAQLLLSVSGAVDESAMRKKPVSRGIFFLITRDSRASRADFSRIFLARNRQRTFFDDKTFSTLCVVYGLQFTTITH
jgi:hypothetical protein